MFIILLISQLGLKSDNLILSDLGRYSVPFFLSDEIEDFDDDDEWEEPGDEGPGVLNYLGEAAGGYALWFAGLMAVMPLSFGLAWGADNSTEEQSKSLAKGLFVLEGFAGAAGSCGGVALAGKLMKQEGAARKALLGGMGVLLAGYLLGNINEGFMVASILVIPIGSVIGYNLK